MRNPFLSFYHPWTIVKWPRPIRDRFLCLSCRCFPNSPTQKCTPDPTSIVSIRKQVVARGWLAGSLMRRVVGACITSRLGHASRCAANRQSREHEPIDMVFSSCLQVAVWILLKHECSLVCASLVRLSQTFRRSYGRICTQRRAHQVLPSAALSHPIEVDAIEGEQSHHVRVQKRDHSRHVLRRMGLSSRS